MELDIQAMNTKDKVLKPDTTENAGDKDMNDSSPVEKLTPEETTSTPIQAGTEILDDADMNLEYLDKREITISLAHNYSNYRKVNAKVLGPKREVIGSSIRSCRTLSSKKGEVDTYFPAIIGLSPSHDDFITRVKDWLSNISMIVTDDNKVLNTSFVYNTKRDYLKIKKLEDAINEKYDKADRSNISVLKEALREKIEALNNLESTKYQFGRPQNVEEYLMYRHCLLYNDVAKDIALINTDSTIRFYIKDNAKEAEKAKKLIESRKEAMLNFVKLDSSEQKFNAVYIAICVLNNKNIIESNLKTRSEKTATMINFLNEQPEKFNKIVKDKNILTKGLIETLISRGELVRSEYNQQISTADGAFIGSNLNEAVAYFDNPNNSEIRAGYENKLKLV